MPHAVAAQVQAFLHGLDGVGARSPAPGEWGLTLEVAGWPLDVGIALRGGWLRLQGEVCGPGQADPHGLLHRGRRSTAVRFTHTGAGAVWVQADVPESAVSPALLDELLGRLVEAAEAVREGVRRTA